MNVYLFGFAKKENSTKSPTITDGVLFSMQLKEETSVINPVLIVNKPNTMPTVYNYAFIPSLQRYYFINDWQYINGAWVCYCNVDVLASHKIAIGQTSAYIERAASAYNGNIIDNLYPATTDVEIRNGVIANSWSGVAPSGGCFVLGVINYQSSHHIGAVSYYALTSADMDSLFNYLFNNNIYTSSSITEIGEGLFKSLFNPFQYIVSCMWFPASVGTYGSTVTNMKIGYWPTNVTANMVDAVTDVRFVTGNIYDHPQISRGEYLNYAPYTRITLYCPPFGAIPIDPYYTRLGHYLYSKVSIDVTSGEAVINVSFRESPYGSYSGKPCIQKTAMMGVPIQLAQVLSDYSGSLNTIMTASSSSSGAEAAGKLISGVLQSAIATQMPQVSTSGSNGSFNTFTVAPELVIEHYRIADEDKADLGRPLMASRQINSLSGFVKCAESHFAGLCYEEERNRINNYLISGFFYE